MASAIVARLFTAGLHLASAEKLLGGDPGGRIGAALAELDGAIGDLRRAVLRRTRPGIA